MNRTITIGMATYDDFDGVYFTIQALRLNHDFCRSSACQFVVYDANPTSVHGENVKRFVESIHQTYVAAEPDAIPSSFDKYKVVEHATGDIVIIVDCHVLLTRSFLEELWIYFNDDDHPENAQDLVQGPLLYDDLDHVSTHMDPVWSGGMFGTWSPAVLYRELKPNPFEIRLQGMGMCCFVKKHWPSIHCGFRGFGGEEGYIADKFRMNGGRNICHPQLRWNHRFYRPSGIPFKCTVEDRVFNYFLANLDTHNDPKRVQQIYQHFEPDIGNPQIALQQQLANATFNA